MGSAGEYVTDDGETRQGRWLSAYGLPEKIWIGYWAAVTVIWGANAGVIPDFTVTMAGNLALLATFLIVPQLTVRLGRVSYDLGRAGFSFFSAYLGYERMATLIDVFRQRSYEYEMLKIDEFLFGGHASVWMEAIHHPILSEYLQAIYLFYFPNMLLVGVGMLVLKRQRLFYEYVIAMNLAMICTHIFYFIVPLRSPFYIVELGLYSDMIAYSRPLEGLWYFDQLRASLLEATTMRHDCFPSGHTMHSLMAAFFAWRAGKKLGIVATIIATSIVFSTLYLRYHYAIDLVAGAVGGVFWIWAGMWLARKTRSEEPRPKWSLARKWAPLRD